MKRFRCYLSAEPVSIDLECFGCTQPAGGPLVAWSEEFRPGKLEPVCLECLRDLDPALGRFVDLAADLARGLADDDPAGSPGAAAAN